MKTYSVICLYLRKFPLFVVVKLADFSFQTQNNLLDHLKAEGRLAMDDAVSIVRKAGALFKKESNLLKLQDPITICGA